MLTTFDNTRRQFLHLSVAAGTALVLGGCANNQPPSTERTEKPSAKEEGEMGGEVTTTEDLMREHGIIRRALLVYTERVMRTSTMRTNWHSSGISMIRSEDSTKALAALLPAMRARPENPMATSTPRARARLAISGTGKACAPARSIRWTISTLTTPATIRRRRRRPDARAIRASWVVIAIT